MGGTERVGRRTSQHETEIFGPKQFSIPLSFCCCCPPSPAPSYIHFKYCLLILLAQLKGVSRINQLLQDIFASKEYYNIVFFCKRALQKRPVLGQRALQKKHVFCSIRIYLYIFCIYIHLSLSCSLFRCLFLSLFLSHFMNKYTRACTCIYIYICVYTFSPVNETCYSKTPCDKVHCANGFFQGSWNREFSRLATIASPHVSELLCRG